MPSIFIFLCLVSQIFSQIIEPQHRFKPSEHENWKLLQNRYCASGNPTSRITGGVEAALGEFPWIVGLIKTAGSETIRYSCSGTILNINTILTAAHCVFPLNGERIIRIVLGDYNKHIRTSCVGDICAPPKQFRAPKEMIIHSRHRDYAPNDTNQFDIALIRLDKDIEFNSYVFPICVLNDELMYEKFVNEDVTVAGWGVYKPDKGARSSIINKVKLRVENNDICDANTVLNYVFSGKQMCLVTPNERIGTCYGDGGGPVMFVNKTWNPPKTYIVGIISVSQVTCGTYAPTIATRVSSFMEWILDNLVENKRDYFIA